MIGGHASNEVLNSKEVRGIKRRMFLVLTLLVMCLMGIQPILAQAQYTAEFEAEAEGTFFVAERLPVEDWEPSILAVGEGDCYIEGKTHDLSRWDTSDNYWRFPADMKLEGELKGTIVRFELERARENIHSSLILKLLINSYGFKYIRIVNIAKK